MAVQRRQPLKIEVPNQKQEALRFGRVGLIVTAGFLIGIIWPRIAGFKLVPSVPSQPAESNSADLTGAPVDAKGPAAAASALASDPEPAPGPTEAPTPADRLQVSEPQFVACRANGKKSKDECDHIEFDRLARPHIQALSSCPGADAMVGLMSLGFDLDFESQTIKGVKTGKSTNLSPADTEAVLACAKKEFDNVSLVGISHKSTTYSIFYRVEFPKPAPKTGTEPAQAASADVTEATGHATVAWDVALVRSSASRDGPVVARVLQGTRVSVTGRRGDWYRIKFDVKGNVGWVYRTAIGM